MKYLLLLFLLPTLVMGQGTAQLPNGYSYGVSDVKDKAIGKWEWHNPTFYLPPKLRNSKGDSLYLETRKVRGFRVVANGRGSDTLTNTQYRYVLHLKAKP